MVAVCARARFVAKGAHGAARSGERAGARAQCFGPAQTVGRSSWDALCNRLCPSSRVPSPFRRSVCFFFFPLYDFTIVGVRFFFIFRFVVFFLLRFFLVFLLSFRISVGSPGRIISARPVTRRILVPDDDHGLPVRRHELQDSQGKLRRRGKRTGNGIGSIAPVNPENGYLRGKSRKSFGDPSRRPGIGRTSQFSAIHSPAIDD